MSEPHKDRRPWPMKWIVLAILVVIVPYTYLTLHYRKPGPAYRPYQDAQERANVVRLLSAGYKRVTLAAQRPADPVKGFVTAPTAAAPGGLPAELVSTLVEKPLLPADIIAVSAAPSTGANDPYTVQFTCTLPDNKQQLAGAQLYVKDTDIYITPDFELLAGGLLARSRESVILLTVPSGTLKAGAYNVRLTGQHSSRTWKLQVH
ncbi:MAG: hypothetical protein NTV51_25935 [Verrucomicrobia bacterium]|nr:hypothetical protein [Verrucomicrobiota bacterium]